MHPASNVAGLRIVAIPTSDVAFSKIVSRLFTTVGTSAPGDFEARLRRTFPRAVVRAREISGEAPTWYVYRDGGWRSSLAGPWWTSPELPRLSVSRDGWIAAANATALGLLEIDSADLGARHFTDFVAPGTLQDSLALFEIVDAGSELTATVLLRPSSGHVVAIDVHAWRDGDALVGVFRLADDVELRGQPVAPVRPTVICSPNTDAAFRGYVDLALSRMPEPTPDGLSLRLRRLYPRAEVIAQADLWVVMREPHLQAAESGDWWTDQSLPTVRYDAQALIVAANDAAVSLLGRSLVGHHWQEFVTPGSTEQVSAMLAILAEAGRAESRFRMPRADGTLVEFDSYTEVDGEDYTTIMRPRPPAPE